MLQSSGSISSATKSPSATLPTTFRTFRAAIMTAGSLVLMALIRGMIFSCMVNLSRAVEDVAFFCSVASPSKPSSPLPAPPQSVTKASKPRTLMARLLVLLKIVAMTGKSSPLMVLKSNTGRTTGKLVRAALIRDGVGDSRAV